MRWTFAVALLLLLAAPAPAQWYEWRDAKGTVHVTNQFTGQEFSQSPTPGAQAPLEPSVDELRRREARLAEQQAHLRLLRAAAGGAASRELENVLTDEMRADQARISALRAGQP